MSGLKRVVDIGRTIESLRRSLKRAGINERDINATWDTEAKWARIRIVTPTGALLCDHRETVTGDRTGVDALAVLARWLDKRTKLVAKGTPLADALAAEVLS